MIKNSSTLFVFAVALFSLAPDKALACQIPDNDSGVKQLDYYRATLAAAEKAIWLNEVSEARYWLDAPQASLRGWEWNFLNGKLDESSKTVHTSGTVITDIQASPDGKTLATACEDAVVRLWDMTAPGQHQPCFAVICAASTDWPGRLTEKNCYRRTR